MISFSLQELPSKQEIKIFTDVALLAKIFHRLIDNAVKFTANGTIFVGFEKIEKEIHFFVKDSGIGISEKHINQIFDNFNQEESTDIRNSREQVLDCPFQKASLNYLAEKYGWNQKKEKDQLFTSPYLLCKPIVIAKKEIHLFIDVNPPVLC